MQIQQNITWQLQTIFWNRLPYMYCKVEASLVLLHIIWKIILGRRITCLLPWVFLIHPHVPLEYILKNPSLISWTSLQSFWHYLKPNFIILIKR
jgi:hypothetical protein